ncbi:MAG TPA: hypothetical protein VET85_10630 [Stellaceae bacterium]|nr:hypothetical protein [Stellaceae bacterium]
MVKALVIMTAAYAVMGGAIALGFLTFVLWLGLVLVLVAVLSTTGLRRTAAPLVHAVAVRAGAGRRGTPPRFTDDRDYLDWTNRQGRWAPRPSRTRRSV